MNDLIHTRLEPGIKDEINKIVKEHYFSSTSEFVKESIRKNLEEYRKKSVIREFEKHFASQPDKKLRKSSKISAAKQALAYKGNIFTDLGLK
jgi:Arc/MetJ-type ribon-helix-helix transcriptional regulator